MSTNQKEEKVPLEKATAEASVGLEKRIEGVINDYVEKKFGELSKAIDTKIDTILKGKEIEVEKALRKGFGLDNDPVIHQSDLIAAIRKAQLEVTEPASKAPAPGKLEKANPEGTTTAEPSLSSELAKRLGGPV